MKLKGLLKSFFILGLTLLPISFSSAYSMVGNNMLEATAPDTAVVGNYVYVFNNNGNFATDSYGQFIYWHNNCAGYSCDYVYGWSNGKLYFAGLFGGNIQTQGYVDTICITTSGTNCTDFDTVNASSFYSSSHNITKILIGLPDSNSLTSASSSAYPLRLCFYDSNNSNYYCVQNNVFNSGYPAGSISNLSGSLSFSSLNGIKDYSWGSSPFSPVSVPPAYLDDGYTNQDVMLSWAKLGYTLPLCYSDFPINILFDMSGSVNQIYDNYLEDGMGAGTGATIIDLFNQVSNISFDSFMSQVVGYTRVMLGKNYIPNYFNGRPVGLGSIGSKILDHLVYFSDTFNYPDYYNYCSYALNISDWDSDYTGPKLPDSVESNLDTERKIRICSQTGAESSAFCGGFSAGGGAGGGSGEVAGIADFYDSFFGLLTSRPKLDGIGEGILPYYICLGFLAFVLIYMFRR